MIKVVKGDITKIPVDAIVNAANTSLLGGGGVDGAIHRAGGSQILEDCIKIRNRQGGCKVGGAVITRAGNLPSKFVIHTVGPVWRGGEFNEENLLALAYENTLKLAGENEVKSISFPNISTGIYNFPKDKAAKTGISKVLEFLKTDNTIEDVIFVCFDSDNYRLYTELLERY
jgi:O-acetyl-ADP-ribose deacetylase (regulator of RNase III)